MYDKIVNCKSNAKRVASRKAKGELTQTQIAANANASSQVFRKKEEEIKMLDKFSYSAI